MTPPSRESSEMLDVARRLSDTPLANAHAQLLERTPVRPRVPIPWDGFRPENYPAAALALSVDQSRKLAEGEYAAVALFGQITTGLSMTGAPIDIVSACASIGGDEVRHADYCLRMAEVCAGRPLTLSIARGEVQRECHDPYSVDEVDFLLLKYSAIGESLAAALLDACERGARDPAARAVYANLVRDEIHHARLGWYYFAWRAPQWTRAERQRLADRVAPFIAGVEVDFHHGRDGEGEEARDAAIALGVLDTERQRSAIAQVMQEEIVPGLDALGLGASHAWARRARGSDARTVSVPALVGLRVAATTAAAPGDEELARARDMAAAWLAGGVAEDGRPRFALDPRGEAVASGTMLHGRAAVCLAALDTHGGHRDAATRLRRWLDDELRAAVTGQATRDWPGSDWMAAGSLALARLAGLALGESLSELLETLHDARRDATARHHAGQVATALGPACPDWVWELAREETRINRWAPWAARAAWLRGDEVTWTHARDGLFATLAELEAPGGALPVAVVSAALEALAPAAADAALRARGTRALGYLWALQHGPGAGEAAGAFPIAPTEPLLRADVTAHALLALTCWSEIPPQ